MTDDERDHVIKELLNVVISQKGRLDELTYRVEALRALLDQTEVPPAEFERVVDAVREHYRQNAASRAEAEKTEQIRRWLATYDGPTQ